MKDWRKIGHVGPEPPKAAAHRKRRAVPRPVVAAPAPDIAGQDAKTDAALAVAVKAAKKR